MTGNRATSLRRLRQLIRLAKDERIQAIRVDGVEFTFSPLAFVGSVPRDLPPDRISHEDPPEEDVNKLLFGE